VRYFGVFSSNAKLRSKIVPATTGIKRRRLKWAERLKRIFGIDVNVCERCGAVTMKEIAIIQDHSALRKIIQHISRKESEPPPARGPPAADGH
jgi:hypothetical protein